MPNPLPGPANKLMAGDFDPAKSYLLSGKTILAWQKAARADRAIAGHGLSEKQTPDGRLFSVGIEAKAAFTIEVHGLRLYVHWGPVWTSMLMAESSMVFPHRKLIIPSIGAGNLVASPAMAPGETPGFLELEASKNYDVCLQMSITPGLGTDPDGSFDRVGLWGQLGMASWAGSGRVVAMERTGDVVGDMRRPTFAEDVWWDHFWLGTVTTDADGIGVPVQWHTGPVFGPSFVIAGDLISAAASPNHLGIDPTDGGLYVGD